MPAFPLQSSNVFSYTFSGAGNTHFHHVLVANNAANPIMNLGGQSWTVECWMKPQNRGVNGQYAAVFGKRRGAGGTNGGDISYLGYIGSTGFVSYYNGANYESTRTLTPNTWNHVAWVFNQGANLRIFVNGTNVLTTTAVTAVNNVESAFHIGFNPNENSQYFGDISNFRVIRGQAIYSGNFDISTYPIQLPNNAIGYHAGTANVASSLTGNVVFLTCNDDTITIDGNNASIFSGNTYTVGTVYPHAVDPLEMIEYSYNNLGQSTVNVNTSRSFILSTDSTNLNVPSGDFTLECWAYIVSGNGALVNKGGAINIAWPSFAISHGLGNVYFAGSNTNARMDIGGDGANGTGGNVHRGYIGTFAKNTWNHVAVSRSGTTYYGFLNGVLGYTETTANTPYNSTGRGLTILGYIENTANSWTGGGVSRQDIAGHISNIRLVTGRALYTSNFTPPQSPLAAIPGTQLLTAKTSTLTDLAGSVTLAANGMGSIGISTFNPFTSNSIINANATVGFSTNYSNGFELGRIYDRFNYSNFGQMINIYPAVAQEPGRIYNKFDYSNFAQPTSIYHAIGQEQGRIYDKFSTEIFAFGVPVIVYTVGQDQGRIYSKILSPTDYAYIPVGGGGGAGTGNVEYQFWS